MGNFRQIPEDVLYHSDMTLEGIRVFAAVQYFDRGGRNGRGCHATRDTIAKQARCDTSTVKRWLKKLCAMGFMEVERATGRGNTNTYRIVHDMKKGGSSDTLSDTERGAAVPRKGGSASEDIEQEQGLTPYKDRTKDSPVKRSKDSAVETAPFLRNGAHPSVFTDSLTARLATYDIYGPFIGFLAKPRCLDDVVGIQIYELQDDHTFLAKLDREVTSGRRFRRDIAHGLRDRLEQIHQQADYSNGDPIPGRAYRLLETELEREAS